jgi:hypothetical protein
MARSAGQDDPRARLDPCGHSLCRGTFRGLGQRACPGRARFSRLAGGRRGSSVPVGAARGGATALTLLAFGMRALGAPDAASATVLLLVFFAAAPSFIIVRAQLFSLVLFCAALLLLRAEAGKPSRRVWLLVPLVALWSNLHGAVLVGLAVAAAYLVLERARREPVVAAWVLAACCAALFLTPALDASGDYYLGVLRSEAAQRGAGMWAPLSLHRPFDVLFILLAIPLLVFAVPSRPRVGAPLYCRLCGTDAARRAECGLASLLHYRSGRARSREAVPPRLHGFAAHARAVHLRSGGVPRHRSVPDAAPRRRSSNVIAPSGASPWTQRRPSTCRRLRTCRTSASQLTGGRM